MSNTLARLYAIFGDAVFLVVQKGTKRPQESAWQKISFADTQEAVYQERLERCVRAGGNIGVVLGPAYNGLYSIDLDDDVLVLIFSHSTRSWGKRPGQKENAATSFTFGWCRGTTDCDSRLLVGAKPSGQWVAGT